MPLFSVEDCELSNPYCTSQNSISRRMTEHLQNVVMKDHMRNIHRNTLTRSKIIMMSPVLRNFIIHRSIKYMKYFMSRGLLIRLSLYLIFKIE